MSTDEAWASHVARFVREVDLAAYQRVVRRLLVNPVVTSADQPLLAAVRRWERELREDLATVADYGLDVSSSTCRLVRRPLALDGTRPLKSTRGSNRPFNARRYAYLCLVLAVLLSSGGQVLLSDLARRLGDDAAAVGGLGFDRDEHAHRTAFVDVIQWLEQFGAMTWRDGATAADLDEDALYDVDHEAVHALVPSLGLRDLVSIQDRFDDSYGDGRDERRRRRRHRVTRMVLERPIVLNDDLDDEERGWLRQNGTRLASDVERLTGLQLERRREGLALIDTEGDGSDRHYPAGGSPAQLALLLGDLLVNASCESLPSAADRHHRLATVIDTARGLDTASEFDSAETPTEGGWPLIALHEMVTRLVAEYPVRRDLRDDPAEAARLAIEVLEAFDLIRFGHTSEGDTVVIPMPTLARYRPIAPEPATDDEQLDLFGAL